MARAGSQQFGPQCLTTGSPAKSPHSEKPHEQPKFFTLPVMSPSDTLGFTVVYVPAGAEHFCVESVSHMTDAVNRSEPAAVTGLRWLAANETLGGTVRYDVSGAAFDI